MRKARLEAGVATHAKMAQRLNMSRPAISKAESPNQAIPSDPLLAAWAKACRVPVEEFTEIVARAKSSAPEWFGPWLASEQQATRLRFWDPGIIPGICQPESYMRVLEKSDAVVVQRLERQKQVIGRAQVTVAISHRVLAHEIGSPAITAEACGHLVRLAESERITLHVVPEGAYIGLGGALAIASHNSLVTVNMTTMTREIVSTAQDLIEEAQAAFESVLGASLPAAQSVEFTRTQEDKWKAQI
jgi:transcriptional regulator with XRE-family HTH domain